MKKLFLFILSFCLLPLSVSANLLVPKSDIVDATFKAVISVDEYVPVSKTILFDASESLVINDSREEKANYIWNFYNGEGEQAGVQQTVSFKLPGKKKVSLQVSQGDLVDEQEIEIFAYKKKALLITDRFSDEEKADIVTQAAELGTWLKVMSIVKQNSSFLTDDVLINLLSNENEFVRESELIVFDTQNFDSLSVFIRFLQSNTTDLQSSLSNKSLVQISDGSFRLQTSITNRSRQILGIDNILLTRPEALNPVLEKDDFDSLVQVLESRAIDYKMINKNSDTPVYLFMTAGVASFIASGVPINAIYLILVFPCLAFLVVFFRQFVGISTYGVYLPIMLALSFFVLGLGFGLGVILLVFILSLAIRHIFTKIEMLYIPRVALTLSTIALSFFIIIRMAITFNSSVVIQLAVFPMLLITTLSERFVSAQSYEGLKGAMIGITETIIIALISYLIMDAGIFRDLILAIPELVFIPLIGIIVLGKYAGLRISEYFKFRSILSEGMEE